MKNPALRGALITAVVVGGLALLRFEPWKRSEISSGGRTPDGRDVLKVGFLPVT